MKADCWTLALTLQLSLTQELRKLLLSWGKRWKQWLIKIHDSQRGRSKQQSSSNRKIKEKEKQTVHYQAWKDGAEVGMGNSAFPAEQLTNEFLLYKQMKEISAFEDPLNWWKTHAATLPILPDSTCAFQPQAALQNQCPGHQALSAVQDALGCPRSTLMCLFSWLRTLKLTRLLKYALWCCSLVSMQGLSLS